MKKRAKKSRTNRPDETYFTLKKVSFIITILVLLILSYLIIKPYLISLISAFILAYLVKPVYEILQKKIKKSFAALLCVLLIVLLILIPFVIIAGKLISQISYFQSLDTNISSSITQKLSSYPLLSFLDINSLKQKGLEAILSAVSSSIMHIPSAIISLIIILFGIYYSLLYWSQITSKLRKIIPFENKNEVEKDISDTTKNIIHGYFLIAILEFIIALIGFYLSGVSFYLFFPFLIAIFAFIPLVGAGTVWVPLSIFYIVTSNNSTAIGIIITGVILVVIDRFIGPKIIEKTSKINPLLFIIGILGGVPLFGIFGFLIGPLVLVYAIKIIKQIISHINAD